jgi:outer membrane immunogenic protein
MLNKQYINWGWVVKLHLLASVSAVALAVSGASGAFAADLPLKAPAPVPYAWWAGPYIGVNLGVVRSESKFWDTGGSDVVETGTIVSDKTGVIGGGQIGYNWQSENLVYGVEADISGLDSKISTEWTVGSRFTSRVTEHNIPWLATFRGRAGLAVGRTMVYVTGGLAVAETKDSARQTNISPGPFFGQTVLIAKDETRVGWTAGFGLEHMLTPNWTVRGEVLYVDLGRGDMVFPSINTICTACTYSGRFSHTLTLARAALNFKW